MSDFIIDKIKSLEIKNKDTDLVIVSFDIDKFNLEEVSETAKQLTSQFPDYHIGFIPEGMEIEIKDIDAMINYLEGLRHGYLHRRQCTS